MDAGNAAEWANVAVTGLALGAAGWAAWSTHRALGIERDRDEKRDMADEAAQAALVAAWPTKPVLIGWPPQNWSATLKNASGVPVYDVTVTYASPHRPDEQPSHSVGLLPPGEHPAPYPNEWCEDEPELDPYSGETNRVMAVADVSVSIMFADSTGMVWQRNERGELSQVRGHDSMRFLRRPVWENSPSGR